jgi:hypothetical protein
VDWHGLLVIRSALHWKKGKIMTNRFRVSGTLARRLEELRVSPDAMLRHAGLPLGLFQHEQDFPDNRRDVRLCGAIHEISGDPGIGLKLGRYQRPEHYSPIAIGASSRRYCLKHWSSPSTK